MTNNLKITGLTGCPNCWQKGNVHACNKQERWKPFPGALHPLKPLLWPMASPNELWAQNRESRRKQFLLRLLCWRKVCCRCCSCIFCISCYLSVELLRLSGKSGNFAFFDTAKLCINTYTGYLCIFLVIHLDPPRPGTAGLWELCAAPSHPSGLPFLSAPWSPVTLRPGISLLTPQLFLIGRSPGQPDSCLPQLLA